MNGGAGFFCHNSIFTQSLKPYDRMRYVKRDFDTMIENAESFNFTRTRFEDFIPESTLLQSFGNGPSLQASIYLQNSYAHISNSTFQGLYSNQSVIHMEDSQVLINTTNFNRNRGSIGTDSSTVSVVRSNLTMNLTAFESNIADIGACIQVIDHSQLLVNQTTFVRNTAYQYAGVLYGAGESNITFNLTEAIENECQWEGAVFVLEGIEANATIVRNSNFTGNYAANNLMSLRFASMIVDKCDFIDNFAETLTHGFYLYQSSLRATEIRVAQSSQIGELSNSKIQSGFFFITANSRLELSERSVIQHTFGLLAAVAFIEGNSFMLAKESYFLDIRQLNAALLGGTGSIVAERAKGILIDQCTFQNCDNVNVFAFRSNVQIYRSAFKLGGRESYVKVVNSQLTVGTSVFLTAEDDHSKGKALNCVGCWSVVIFNNEFQQLRAKRGGAIYLEGTTNSQIYNNEFTNNTAEQGGGIYLFDSEVILNANTFTDNQAQSKGFLDERDIRTQHEGTGGAIFFTCVNLQDSSSYFRELPEYDQFGNYVNTTEYLKARPNCQVDVRDNIFVRNQASDKAGAMMYTNVNFTESAPNNFTNNAAPNGNNLSSPPEEIEIILWGENRTQSTQGRRLQSEDQRIVVSGQQLPIQIALINREGQIASDDSSTVAELTFKGQIPDFGLIRGNAVLATKGIFDFSSFYLTMQPGQSTFLDLMIMNLETYGNEIEFLSAPVPVEIYSRPCELGESLTQDRKCIVCPPGTYSVKENITEPHSCSSCPNHAICFGGADLTPAQGFTRVHNRSVILLRCINTNACLKPERKDSLGKCDTEKGYVGYMCSECTDGFWRRENFHQCYKCNESNLARFLWVCIVLFFLLVIVWIINVYHRNKDNKRQVTIPIVRILITYLQLYSILSGLEMFQGSNGVNFFLRLFNIRAILLTPAETIFDFQCLSGISLANKYFLLMVFQTLLPVIILLTCFLVYVAIHFVTKCFASCRKKKNRKKIDLEQVKNKTYVATTILMYIVYPKMVEQLLGSVHCFDALDDGPGDVIVQRVRNHPDILCSDSNYKWYKGFVLVPGVIIWVVAFPLFLVKNFFDKKLVIYQSQCPTSADDSNVPLVKRTETVKCQYSFLYTGLRVELPKNLSSEDEAERNAEIRAEKEFYAGKPNIFAKFLHQVTKVPQLFKQIFVMVSGKGLDIQNKTTLRVQSFFYWEIIVFFGKLCLILITIFMRDVGADIQTNLTLTVIAVLLFFQLRNHPYQRDILNSMHVILLLTIMIVLYTRTIIRDFNIGYGNWTTDQQNRGYDPLTEELGQVARLYEFDTKSRSFFNNLLIIVVICFTFYIDLYFLYHLYIQGLLYLYEYRKVRLFKLFTFNNLKIQRKIEDLWEDEEVEEEDKDSGADENVNEVVQQTPSISKSDFEQSPNLSSFSDSKIESSIGLPKTKIEHQVFQVNRQKLATFDKDKGTARSVIMSDDHQEFELDERRQLREPEERFDQDQPLQQMKSLNTNMIFTENGENLESHRSSLPTQLIKLKSSNDPLKQPGFKPKIQREGNLQVESSIFDSEVMPEESSDKIKGSFSSMVRDQLQSKTISESDSSSSSSSSSPSRQDSSDPIGPSNVQVQVSDANKKPSEKQKDQSNSTRKNPFMRIVTRMMK